MAFDVIWVVENRGLMTRRIDVLSLTNEKILILKSRKSLGPSYDKKVNVEVVSLFWRCIERL